MVSFEGLRLNSGSPIYRQIVLYIKKGIASGRIADGEELPSRRVLSALLGVNPNTVQKAFGILEEEGMIRSHSGARSFVKADSDVAGRIRMELTLEQARALASSMKQMGVTREQTLELIDRVWGEEE